MNIENLKAAQKHLTENVFQEVFNMLFYREDPDNVLSYFNLVESPICNSVGCAVGHCTVLDPKGFSEFVKDNEDAFYNWSISFFELDKKQWDYLFSSHYYYSDNTIEGCVSRIQYLIDNQGVCPQN